MAVSFSVEVNGKIVDFEYDNKTQSMVITAIDSQKTAIICQAKSTGTLDEAREQAIMLVQNKNNKLFWHPV